MKTNELKCTDLRIGNYVKHYDPIYGTNIYTILDIKGRVGRVFLDSDTIGSASCGIEHIEPIELTEEVLVKIGFKKIYQSRFTKGMFELNYDISDNEFINVICRLFENGKLNLTIIERYGSMMGDNSLYKNGIKYLHQLQNAYFILAGQELEVEL